MTSHRTPQKWGHRALDLCLTNVIYLMSIRHIEKELHLRNCSRFQTPGCLFKLYLCLEFIKLWVSKLMARRAVCVTATEIMGGLDEQLLPHLM